MSGWRQSSKCNSGHCVQWKRSSKCAATECVETAHENGDVLVRDGKLGDASPVLRFTSEEWQAFKDGIRAGDE